MGKSSRTKGATFEREICIQIRETLGVDAKRNLVQTREGGGDILLAGYVLECKRRAKIAVYEWLEQADGACTLGEKPVVVCRGDNKEALVIMRFDDFLPLLGNELDPTSQNVSCAKT